MAKIRPQNGPISHDITAQATTPTSVTAANAVKRPGAAIVSAAAPRPPPRRRSPGAAGARRRSRTTRPRAALASSRSPAPPHADPQREVRGGRLGRNILLEAHLHPPMLRDPTGQPEHQVHRPPVELGMVEALE